MCWFIQGIFLGLLMLLLCFQPSSPVKESSTQQLTKQATSLDWAGLPLHYSVSIYLIPSNLRKLQAPSFSPCCLSVPLSVSSPFFSSFLLFFSNLCSSSSSSYFIPCSSSPRLSAPPTFLLPNHWLKPLFEKLRWGDSSQGHSSSAAPLRSGINVKIQAQGYP